MDNLFDISEALKELRLQHKYVIPYRGYPIVLDEGQTIKSKFEDGVIIDYIEMPDGTPIILGRMDYHWQEIE